MNCLLRPPVFVTMFGKNVYLSFGYSIFFATFASYHGKNTMFQILVTK